MTIRPRVIIVESHGIHGAPTGTVTSLLKNLSYEVEDLGWAEPSRLRDCQQGDIRVLVARRMGSGGRH
jgi:hypothetical protein